MTLKTGDIPLAQPRPWITTDFLVRDDRRPFSFAQSLTPRLVVLRPVLPDSEKVVLLCSCFG